MKPIYSNDKKAPRMKKGKYSTQVLTIALYKEFCKKHPEYKLTWAQFKEMWLDLAETIRIEAITNALGVKLGSYTGELKLQYLPHKFEADAGNIEVSNELGERLNIEILLLEERLPRLNGREDGLLSLIKCYNFMLLNLLGK